MAILQGTKKEKRNKEDLDEILGLDLDDSIGDDSASSCNSTTLEEITEDLEFNVFDVSLLFLFIHFPLPSTLD